MLISALWMAAAHPLPAHASDGGTNAAAVTSECAALSKEDCARKAHELQTGRLADQTRAARVYEEACGKGDPESCYNAGSLLDRHGGDAGALHALDLRVKACLDGFAHACFTTGMVYRQGRKTIPKSFTAAVDYFRKGCDAHDGDACAELAGAYAMGQGVKKDRKKAAHYMKEAAANGYQGGD